MTFVVTTTDAMDLYFFFFFFPLVSFYSVLQILDITPWVDTPGRLVGNWKSNGFGMTCSDVRDKSMRITV